MSETDDTDELLIIPPDFFLTNPDLEHFDPNFVPYYSVVDTLISQVSKLENRVNSIETSSDASLIDDMNASPARLRKFGSSEELPQKSVPSESTQSTPQKPRTKFTLNSLPSSPNVDRFKPARKFERGKKPEVNPMLGEIDSFISNVKTIKRLNAMRSLEGDFNSSEHVKNLDAEEVDEMLRKMETQQKKLEEPFAKKKVWQAGDNVDSVPDYGCGMRKNLYPDLNASNERAESDSSESTQTTAYDRFKSSDVHSKAVDVLNLHKKLLEGSDSDFNLGLLSLSNLWNSKGESPKFQQKLQEERLRRQHCEQTIKELQNRVLELQERLAVAVQVDEAKDKAILRFHECWEKAGSKLQDLEKEKAKLEGEIDRLKRKSAEDSEEAAQKAAHYEKEASKALNIAHGVQEKLASLERHCADLNKEREILQSSYEELQRKYAAEAEKNKQYPEIIAQKELELNENKTVLAQARTEVAQSKRAVEICQDELSSLKDECGRLQARLKDEKDAAAKSSEQRNKLVEEISAHKNIERGLQEELNKTREQLENNKVELKNFYQGQVELVVQNKLKEFQAQLDEAEKALKDELARKELSVAKMAASHIQQLSDKYSLEITLLEQKHQEECRLYQLQLSQRHQELEEANARLKRQQEKHAHIERHLYKFMESLRQDHVATVDDLNSFRSKSYNNLEEILSWRAPEEERNRKEEESERNSQMTYKVTTETPVTSRNDKGAKRRENLLQETIQMLLERRPLGDAKNHEDGHQSGREGFMPFYQRLSKETKGKPPWK